MAVHVIDLWIFRKGMGFEKKPYFLSLQNSLCKREKAAFQADGVHLTHEGKEMIARRISTVMMERFFSKSL